MNWTTISDIIEDVMDVGFDVVLEDGSADDISKHICQLYFDWSESMDGRKKVIDKLKSLSVIIPIQVVPIRTKREQQKVNFKIYFIFLLNFYYCIKLI